MENEKALIPEGQSLPEIKEPKKEVIPISHVAEEMEKLIPLAGTIELSEEKKKILFAPVKDEDVEIRPDGLIYLPWMEYVSRLRDAFGVSWAIIPKDMPKFQGNHVYWPFYLMIQGKLAGFAIGEQQYHPTNATMTYGDAVEGAKSNALMRLCKGLGISLELWKPSFIRGWKERYAEEYYDEDKKKKLWRKKNGKQNTSSEDIERLHKESEKKCSEYHDRLIKIENKFELENYWKKHSLEIEKELLPEHLTLIVKLKDDLKGKLK